MDTKGPPPPSYSETTGQPPYSAGQQPYPAIQQQPYPAIQQQPYPAGQPYGHAVQVGPVPAGRAIIVQPGQTAIVVNANICSACQIGVLVETFSCVGLCLGIFCFPIGLICCLMLKERKCTHCRASFPS